MKEFQTSSPVLKTTPHGVVTQRGGKLEIDRQLTQTVLPEHAKQHSLVKTLPAILAKFASGEISACAIRGNVLITLTPEQYALGTTEREAYAKWSAALIKAERDYDNIHNEGYKDGFNPHRIWS